ncbi:hypothetical protein BGX26_002409 [Mortierella sp. AD094]|nr:hypothetical protein BGX26_002409 [Mortierella sp. AD094]
MDLVRSIQVTGDDNSTIFQRLKTVRTTNEALIQKAKGDRSANLNRKAAIDHFKSSGLLHRLPVQEADLEPYYLTLYMESVIMSTLIEKFFVRPLGCIYDMYKGLVEQQLCTVASQCPAEKSHKELEVIKIAANLITVLVAKVYLNVDVWAKLNELCTDASDLSIAVFGMESQIYPIPILLDAPFDDETVNTPQRSNPDGKVSLAISPAFADKNCVFKMKPKDRCALKNKLDQL